MMTVGRGMGIGALVLATVVTGSIAVRAQGSGAQPDVLTGLLTEVRALRSAMEQMASAGPRVQLALGRLQLQEQRVDTIIRRLDSIRDSISSAERELNQKRQQLALFENMLREPDSDPKDLGHMTTALKGEIATGTTTVQKLQGDELNAMQELSVEQARWSEINRRVEELERTLGGR